MAWGPRKVAADAFLTGVVVVSHDLKRMRVVILAFGRDGEEFGTVSDLTAATDAPSLAEAGESFLARGAFNLGHVEEVAEGVAATASRVKKAEEANPLLDNAAPVRLEIRYDEQPVPLEFRDGKAFVREPGRDQKVSLVLREVDQGTDRYGVVLLVNDQNTLYKERTAPLRASKWILGPDHRETAIRGYQISDRTAEAFRVLSEEESRRGAVRYGPAAGTITLVVFREKSQGQRDQPPILDDTEEDLAAIARGTLPEDRPETLRELKFRLREGTTQGVSRGLIAEGQAIGASIRPVEFRPAPTPVMSATVIYYRP